MGVYLDHNATSPLRQEARARWLEVADELAGNPSSLHAGGRRARAVIDGAREEVAGALGVADDEVLFTAGGTDANNRAIFGAVEGRGTPCHVVSSPLEHSSALEPVRALGRAGHRVTLLPADRQGALDLSVLERAVQADPPTLVTLAAANGEMGSLTPLTAVAERLADVRGERPCLHTDAVQALGRIPVRPAAWGVDAASFSAHKVGGPVGIGVLWRRRGLTLQPRTFGGGQEADLVPGTEDACGIAATATAVALAVAEQSTTAESTARLCRTVWGELARSLPDVRLVGPELAGPRLPNTLCILFPGLDGKVLVTRLDLEGLAVSAGSACASGSVEPSHVLLALGYDADEARSALRVSLGRDTTQSDCTRAVDILRKLAAVSRAT